MWFGPTPRVNISDPELIKYVLNKIYDFQKPNASPLVRLLANGLVNLEGEKWSKHRKLINPAFNIEKLKASFLRAVLNHVRTVYFCKNQKLGL